MEAHEGFARRCPDTTGRLSDPRRVGPGIFPRGTHSDAILRGLMSQTFSPRVLSRLEQNRQIIPPRPNHRFCHKRLLTESHCEQVAHFLTSQVADAITGQPAIGGMAE